MKLKDQLCQAWTDKARSDAKAKAEAEQKVAEERCISKEKAAVEAKKVVEEQQQKAEVMAIGYGQSI